MYIYIKKCIELQGILSYEGFSREFIWLQGILSYEEFSIGIYRVTRDVEFRPRFERQN